MHFLNSNEVDLLFLDIKMAGLTGLELLDQIISKPLVIFTTAYKDFLQAGFDNGILDYLQKPIKKERLTIALERAKDQLQKNFQASDHSNIIYVRSGNKEISLAMDQILFIKSARDYCILFLNPDRKVLVKISMEALLEKLGNKSEFVRVHRSFIISSGKIETIKSYKSITISHYDIPIGRMYRKAFYTHLENYKKLK